MMICLWISINIIYLTKKGLILNALTTMMPVPYPHPLETIVEEDDPELGSNPKKKKKLEKNL
jgi:hypothetical protein